MTDLSWAAVAMALVTSPALACYYTDPRGEAGPQAAIQFGKDVKGNPTATAAGVLYRIQTDPLTGQIRGVVGSNGSFIAVPMPQELDAHRLRQLEVQRQYALTAAPTHLAEILAGAEPKCGIDQAFIDLGHFGVHPLFGGFLQNEVYWRGFVLHSLTVGPGLAGFSGAECSAKADACKAQARFKFETDRQFCEPAGLLVGMATSVATRSLQGGGAAGLLSWIGCLVATGWRYEDDVAKCEREQIYCEINNRNPDPPSGWSGRRH